MGKAEVRRALLAQRARAHGAEGQGPLAPQAAWLGNRLAPSATLGLYQAIKTERDPHPMLSHLTQQRPDVRLAAPKVLAPDQPLAFFAFHGPEDLAPGAFGVLEPKDGLARVKPDVILVPLVGFDRAGYRLGYGGGFYDRTLARAGGSAQPVAIGCAYDGQLSDCPLDFEPTDRALDGVLTPRFWWDFSVYPARATPWC